MLTPLLFVAGAFSSSLPVAESRQASLPDIANAPLEWDGRVPGHHDGANDVQARDGEEDHWRNPGIMGHHGLGIFGNNPSTSTSSSSTSTSSSNQGDTNNDPPVTANGGAQDTGDGSAINYSWPAWPSTNYGNSISGGEGGSGGGGTAEPDWPSAANSTWPGTGVWPKNGAWDWSNDPAHDRLNELFTLMHDQPATSDPLDPAPEPAFSALLLGGLFAAGLAVTRRFKLAGKRANARE